MCMLNFYYKVKLALLDNKIIKQDKHFILSYDIPSKVYNIWYIGAYNELNYYGTCEDVLSAKFQWNILMSRGEESC